MSHLVRDIEVTLPSKQQRAQCAAVGKKPMAAVAVMLENGKAREIVVPVRVGRLLAEGAVSVPREEEDVFDAIHALEGRVCFAMITEMLSRRDMSEGELIAKLRLYGFREQEISPSLKLAREHRYVNDARFATYFIEERIRRGWGPRKIELELRRRGIDPKEVPGYPEAFFTEEFEHERAMEILRRKPIPEERARERLMRFLVSKGFSYSVARDAVLAYLHAHE